MIHLSLNFCLQRSLPHAVFLNFLHVELKFSISLMQRFFRIITITSLGKVIIVVIVAIKRKIKLSKNIRNESMKKFKRIYLLVLWNQFWSRYVSARRNIAAFIETVYLLIQMFAFNLKNFFNTIIIAVRIRFPTLHLLSSTLYCEYVTDNCHFGNNTFD